MTHTNSKPSAAEFFRKYSEIVSEAEKKEVEVTVCKKCGEDPCECETEKKEVKESTDLYRRMMGEATLSEKWDKQVKLNPAKKGTMPKSKAKVNSELAALKKSGPHKKGSAEYTKEKELNFAKRAKSGWKESVEEATKSKKTVKEAAGAGRYIDSLEGFEYDISDMNQALLIIKRTIRSPEWNDWMQATDSNYNPPTSAQMMSKELTNKILEAQRVLYELYNMMANLD